jgi:hypothetical protein
MQSSQAGLETQLKQLQEERQQLKQQVQQVRAPWLAGAAATGCHRRQGCFMLWDWDGRAQWGACS